MTKDPKTRRIGWTKKLKYLAEQDFICFYCFRPLAKDSLFEIDHIIPWSYSKDSSRVNLAIVCQGCNMIKGHKVFNSVEDIREFIKTYKTKPTVNRKWSKKHNLYEISCKK